MEATESNRYLVARIQTFSKRRGSDLVDPIGNNIFITDGRGSKKDKPDMRNTLIQVQGATPPSNRLRCTLWWTSDGKICDLVKTGHNQGLSTISLSLSSSSLEIYSAPCSGICFPKRSSRWRRKSNEAVLQFEVQLWLPVPEGKVVLQLESEDGQWIARSNCLTPITSRQIRSGPTPLRGVKR